MSGTITVSSTTDSQKDVDAAADYGEQTLPFSEEEKPGTPSEVDETETAAEPETAEPPENEEEEEEEEKAPEEEPEPPEAAQRPMGQTRRQREAALARLLARDEAREKRMAEMEERLRRYEQPPSPPKPDFSRRPDENDPKYVGKYGDFVEDMSRYVRQQEEREKVESQQKQLQQQQAELGQKVLREYHEQLEIAKAAHPDFYDVVRPVEQALPEWLQLQTMDLPNGAEVAYYLGKHPETIDQLLDLNRAEVRGGAIEMSGMLRDISRQLKGDDQASSPPSSPSRSPQPRPAAPRPLRHVGGSSAATTPTIDPGKMSYRQYDEWRKAGGGR